MDKKDFLYEFAKENNFVIREVNNIDLKGASLILQDKKIIFLNSSLINDSRDEFFILLEEIAHLSAGISPTLLFSSSYTERITRSQNEFRAFKWVVDRILSLNYLKSNMVQYSSIYDMSCDLDISEELLSKIFSTHNFKGGGAGKCVTTNEEMEELTW